jgi:hypothetical protein
VPSVTLVDPDGVVARGDLGEVVGDLPSLVSAVRAWMSDPARRRESGARARTHVSREHAPELTLSRMAELLRLSVAAGSGAAGSAPGGRPS